MCESVLVKTVGVEIMCVCVTSCVEPVLDVRNVQPKLVGQWTVFWSPFLLHATMLASCNNFPFSYALHAYGNETRINKFSKLIHSMLHSFLLGIAR